MAEGWTIGKLMTVILLVIVIVIVVWGFSTSESNLIEKLGGFADKVLIMLNLKDEAGKEIDISRLTQITDVRDILISQSLIAVRRIDEEALKLSTLAEIKNENFGCLNPMTKPIQIFLDDDGLFSGGAYIDFVWDAKENEAKARNIHEIQFHNYRELVGDKDKVLKIFTGLDEDEKDWENIVYILSAENFDEFIDFILYVGRGNGPGADNDDEIIGVNRPYNRDIIKNKIVYEDYYKNWVEPGDCLDKEILYTCLKGGENIDCILKASGKICYDKGEEGYGDSCEGECLCPEHLRNGDFIYSKIGNQCWEYKLENNFVWERCVDDSDSTELFNKKIKCAECDSDKKNFKRYERIGAFE